MPVTACYGPPLAAMMRAIWGGDMKVVVASPSRPNGNGSGKSLAFSGDGTPHCAEHAASRRQNGVFRASRHSHGLRPFSSAPCPSTRHQPVSSFGRECDADPPRSA